jgi:poly-gamma-glutamate synthesis protein (capsule biosynthesis protein)
LEKPSQLSSFSFLFIAVFCLVGSSHPTESTEQGSSQQEPEVVMRFGGDVLLAAHYEEYVGNDINRAFKEFELFRTDDMSMVNLEVPVTTRGAQQRKPFTFRMKPRFLEAITSAGIDVVNIANNHIYDFGNKGLYDTIASLDSAKLAHVGAGRNHDEAHRPFIKVINGKKIGILGYYGGGEAPAATGKSCGVAARELNLIERDIRSLKEKDKVDYVVINLHWGTEKAKKPDAEQRAFAHDVIEAGADAIIGHHPHVLQGIELYRNKVIVYSLGNLVFGGNGRHSYDTGVFEIRLSDRGAAFQFIPVRIFHWKASVLTGSAGDSLLKKMRKLSSIFPQSIFN